MTPAEPIHPDAARDLARRLRHQVAWMETAYGREPGGEIGEVFELMRESAEMADAYVGRTAPTDAG